MRKITKFITTLLACMIMISFIPNEIASATEKKQRKNKNIETGYIYGLIQYEDNFIMEYNSPVAGYRIVNKNGDNFGLYEEEYYNADLFSRYAYTSDGKIIDLKDFSKINIENEIVKVKKELEDRYEGYYFEVYLENVINGKYVYNVYGINDINEIMGIYCNKKLYELDYSCYDNTIVGNNMVFLANEVKENTQLWYIEIIDENTGERIRVNLFETEHGDIYELEYLGNKLIVKRENEVIRYKIENNKVIKIDSIVGSNLKIDKDGEVWTINGKNIIKYENGNQVIKKVLDKEYINIFVYDENRIVVDNRYSNSIKVIYPNMNKGQWESIGGYYYYFEDGIIQTGWKFIDGNYYYLNENGTMQIGWLKLNGSWYYLDHTGRMAEGAKEIDGIGYYFDQKTGVMQNNGWIYDNKNNEYRYCQENGALFKGWLYLNNNYYYLDKYGIMVTGYYQIDNENYSFDYESGIMQTGWIWAYDEFIEDHIGGYNYFSPSGAQKKGWQWINGAYYYLETRSGFMQTEWINLDGTYYYLGNDGAMRTGWEWINGAYYYLATGGEMLTGWQWINGAYYYLEAGGQMATGWRFVDNNWYYLYGSGIMATNTTIDGWKIGYDGIAIKIA